MARPDAHWPTQASPRSPDGGILSVTSWYLGEPQAASKSRLNPANQRRLRTIPELPEPNPDSKPVCHRAIERARRPARSRYMNWIKEGRHPWSSPIPPAYVTGLRKIHLKRWNGRYTAADCASDGGSHSGPGHLGSETAGSLLRHRNRLARTARPGPLDDTRSVQERLIGSSSEFGAKVQVIIHGFPECGLGTTAIFGLKRNQITDSIQFSTDHPDAGVAGNLCVITLVFKIHDCGLPSG